MEINCKYCPKNDGTGNCLINGCPLPPVIKGDRRNAVLFGDNRK